MYNPVSDSFCFNLQMVDSYYRSVMQEVCFQHFPAREPVFHILYGSGIKCE